MLASSPDTVVKPSRLSPPQVLLILFYLIFMASYPAGVTRLKSWRGGTHWLPESLQLNRYSGRNLHKRGVAMKIVQFDEFRNADVLKLL